MLMLLLLFSDLNVLNKFNILNLTSLTVKKWKQSITVFDANTAVTMGLTKSSCFTQSIKLVYIK